MESYLLYVVVASAVILSPGPGVVHTLSNSIRRGLRGSVGGIIGIASGTFVVATAAATSVGLILATSAPAFTVMKYIGAAYLVALGVKRWRAPALKIDDCFGERERSTEFVFVEGALIQILNPKAILFFMSIFPQFINSSSGYIGQFAILVSTYGLLVIAIHLAYAVVAESARTWLSSPERGRFVNRASGVTFIGFGLSLATTNR